MPTYYSNSSSRVSFDFSSLTESTTRWTTSVNDIYRAYVEMASGLNTWYQSIPPVTRLAMEDHTARSDPAYVKAADSGAPESFLATMRKRKKK